MGSSGRSDVYLDLAFDLLDRVKMLDGHNDLAIVIRRDPMAKGDVRQFELERDHPEYDTDIPRLRAGKVGYQVWAAFVATQTPDPGRAVDEQIDLILDFAHYHPDVFYNIRSSADFAAGLEGSVGSILAVEGCVGMNNDLSRLSEWYDKGVRLVTLCHTMNLDWVDSSTDMPRANGLTSFGKDVIREMNRLGLIVDCSHSSSVAAHQVLDVSTAPIAFSHSNAHSLCSSPRNVPDDLLARIPENDGIVMATFIRDYVSQAAFKWMEGIRPHLFGLAGSARSDMLDAYAKEVGPCPNAKLAQVADHIEYIAEIVGPSRIGIGSDFYGVKAFPVGLEDVSCYPFLIAELFRRGWSEEYLTGLAGANFRRVFKAVEDIRKLGKRSFATVGPA